MRWLLVLALAVPGCKKEEAARELPKPAVAGAAQADAGARPKAGTADAAAAPRQVDIDLLRAIDTHVAVSSVVANPKFSPFDLFDSELTTAWNSRTGDLVGAWIAFRVPSSTHVSAVQLTAGFSAKGREGDYFTMNPRIKRVAIWHDGVRLREQDLDVSSRELQTVAVDANGGDYKLEVVAIVAGTKKSWREICVSELRVIGRPPPGMKTGLNFPDLSIGSLDGKPLTWDTFELVEESSYDSLDAFCADYIARKPAPCEPWDHACEAKPEANTCGGTPAKTPTLPALPAGWKPHWILTKLGNQQKQTCNLALEAGGKFYVREYIGGEDCGAAVDVGLDTREWSRSEADVSEVMGDGGEPELTMIVTTPGAISQYSYATQSEDLIEDFIICSAGTTGTPHCGDVTVGDIVQRTSTGDGPGADGIEWWNDRTSKGEVTVANGVLDVKKISGVSDSIDPLVGPGRHRIRVVE